MLLVSLPPRVIYWAKVVSKFISVQLVVQALNFSSGILLIRALDQTQYAYFTVANTMQSTMNLLADMGISISLSALGGKVWQDRYRFGQLINTAMQLRFFLAKIAVAVVSPILLWMLIKNGSSIPYAFLLTLLVLVGLNFQLTAGVLLVVPRLHSQIDEIQKLDMLSAIARLGLLGVAFLTFVNSAVAIATASITAWLQCAMLQVWTTNNIDIKATIHEKDRKAILDIVKHEIPNGIYYCFQGQLTIWLVSAFGNTETIAEVGALGRLGLIFSLISAIMTNIIYPSFSRCQSPRILTYRYWQILGTITTFGLILVGSIVFFSDEILWVLGNKYTHLRTELTLMMGNAVLNSIVGTMWSMNAAKAWIKYSWLNIPFTTLLQIFLLTSLNVSTVRGVIEFSILSLIPSFIVNLFLTYYGILTYKESEK